MKENMRFEHIWPGALAVLTVLFHACSGELSGEQSIQRAKQSIQKGENQEAILLLKTATQSAAPSPEIRFLLGKALLQAELFGDAEIELRKAYESGFERTLSAPALARAMLENRRDSSLVDLLGKVDLHTEPERSDLSTSVAIALARLNKPDDSRARLSDVLKVNPNYSRAQIFSARIAAGSGDFEGGAKIIEGVLARAPSDFEAILAKADLILFGKNNVDSAAQYYEAALKLQPKNISARSALIAILFQKRNATGIRAQIQELKKYYPNSGQTLYFEAQASFLEEDYVRAREQITQIVRAFPEAARAHQLAGAVEMKLNSLNLAESYLAKTISLDQQSPVARRLLAQIYNRTGQPAKTLTILRPILEGSAPDTETLVIAAEACIQSGDVGRAEALYRNALATSPSDARVKTSLALAMLSRGSAESAFAALENTSKTDPSAIADLAIINARLKRREYESALAAAETLVLKQPNSAHAEYLKAQILSALQQTQSSEESLFRSNKKDPLYYPAVAALATLDASRGKTDAAIGRLTTYSQLQKHNAMPLIGIAELKVKTGAGKSEVLGILDSAIKADPADVGAWITKASYQLKTHDPKAATTTAQEALVVLPNDPAVLDSLGRAQLASGDVNQASLTFTKITNSFPKLVSPHIRLAEVYLAKQDTQQAKVAFRRALSLQPENTEAQLGLIALAVQTKDFASAREISRSTQQHQPKEMIGYLFEADVELAAGKVDAAAAALLRGLASAKPGSVPIKLHNILLDGRRDAEAAKFAADWSTGHPRDLGFLMHLGDASLARNKFDQAEAAYRKILAIEPKHGPALNNVAWLMAQQGKKGSVQMAEAALSSEPNSAPYLDTYATCLDAEGRTNEALEASRKAALAKDGIPLYSLNYAKALVKSQRRGEALEILKKLSTMKDTGIPSTEIDRLRKLAS